MNQIDIRHLRPSMRIIRGDFTVGLPDMAQLARR